MVSCVWPPHVYVGGNQAIWCETSDPDGDTVSTPSFSTSNSNARVTSVISGVNRWDGTPCPSGKTCYRATLWGDTAGMVTITATVSDGELSASDSGTVEVVPDEF